MVKVMGYGKGTELEKSMLQGFDYEEYQQSNQATHGAMWSMLRGFQEQLRAHMQEDEKMGERLEQIEEKAWAAQSLELIQKIADADWGHGGCMPGWQREVLPHM